MLATGCPKATDLSAESSLVTVHRTAQTHGPRIGLLSFLMHVGPGQANSLTASARLHYRPGQLAPHRLPTFCDGLVDFEAINHFTAKRRAIREALAADGVARDIESLVDAILPT